MGEDGCDYKPGDLIRAAQDYVVVKALGAGGMGSVYLAKHRVLYRPFVLKLLRAEHFHRTELIEMFEAEARTVARLGEPEPHPGIIEVVDLGRTKDRGCMPYMVMPYLVGETLAAALERRGRLPVLESIGVVTRILQALDHAHRRGIVHRDVKADNIFIPQVNEGISVKVLDWGISKLVAQARDPHIFLGTPAWASREQMLGHGIGPLSDVYSAGVVLFRCLTGAMPFAAHGSGFAELKKALDVPAPRITEFADFPLSLENLVARALAKDPAGRPVDALAFATTLQEVGEDFRRRQSSPRLGPAIARAAPAELITEANIAGLTVEDPDLAERIAARAGGGRTRTVPMSDVVVARRATVPMVSSRSVTPEPVIVDRQPPSLRPLDDRTARGGRSRSLARAAMVAVLLVASSLVFATWTIVSAPDGATNFASTTTTTASPDQAAPIANPAEAPADVASEPALASASAPAPARPPTVPSGANAKAPPHPSSSAGRLDFTHEF